jgi:hypothetical protein
LCVIDWRSFGILRRVGRASATSAEASAPFSFFASVRSACAVFEPSR